MVHCAWPPAAVGPIPSQLGFDANWKMSSGLAAALIEGLRVSVMSDTSCPSQDDPCLEEYPESFTSLDK